MEKQFKDRRKKFFANPMHRQTFMLVLMAALIPAIIVTICLYYLIFGIASAEAGFPEAIGSIIMPAAKQVTAILLLTAPLIITIILIFAYKITHRIVGPFDRIVYELDAHIKDRRKSGPIRIRKSDKFHELVEKINHLLDKLKLPVGK